LIFRNTEMISSTKEYNFCAVWIAGILFSCQSTTETPVSPETSGTSEILVNPPKRTYQADSLELAYYKGKYFFPNRLRLEGENPGCVLFCDTSFTQRERIDSADWEQYQDSIRPLLSPDVLRAHKVIWALPEMQEEKCGPCGYSDRFTMYTMPEKTDSGVVYPMELKRDYYDALRTTNLAYTFYYRPRDGQIWVFDMAMNDYAGALVTLKAWRKWRKERDLE
jgi:hypothetical protein